MCIFNTRFFVAEKDIVCYKIAIKYNNEHFKAPWMRTDISLNVEYSDDLPIEGNNGGKGFFHTFIILNDAIRYKNYFENAVILKAIIPKGTICIQGVFPTLYQGPLPSYASKKIIYQEEIC